LEGDEGNSVSREHAKIETKDNTQAQLTDLDSSNGTLLNDQVISGPVVLKVGDVIQFGYTGGKLLLEAIEFSTTNPQPSRKPVATAPPSSKPAAVVSPKKPPPIPAAVAPSTPQVVVAQPVAKQGEPAQVATVEAVLVDPEMETPSEPEGEPKWMWAVAIVIWVLLLLFCLWVFWPRGAKSDVESPPVPERTTFD
jgi:pSer/pThr/pTyr-binding forkhead associated (FHA) protein